MAKSKILHIGVFGCRRGKTYIKALKIGKLTGARVTALCDMDESRMEACAEYCQKGRLAPKRFTNAEEFFNSGLFEAVILCNYFSEHAKYAALALSKGIHVLSETGRAYPVGRRHALRRRRAKQRRIYDGGKLPLYQEQL